MFWYNYLLIYLFSIKHVAKAHVKIIEFASTTSTNAISIAFSHFWFKLFKAAVKWVRSQ